MKVSVVIPAAGKGKRMQTEKSKQFLTLKDKEILAYTLEKFDFDLIDEIIVVTGADDIEFCRKEIIDKYGIKRVKSIVAGGKNRQESVYNGLKEVSDQNDVVIIHDGVRPFVNRGIIEKGLDSLTDYDAVAIGVSVKDTIKVTNKDGIIINTPDRSKLIAAQTPQIFKKDLIIRAYEQAFADNFISSDSSSLVERLNMSVKVINGSYRNIKITTPTDLLIAEKIVDGVKECM